MYLIIPEGGLNRLYGFRHSFLILFLSFSAKLWQCAGKSVSAVARQMQMQKVSEKHS